MLDINRIRNETKAVKKNLLKRGINKKVLEQTLERILELDERHRKFLQKVEILKARRNKYSKTKPKEVIISQMKNLGKEIKDADDNIKIIETDLNTKLSELPNMVADEVPAGGKENNRVLKTFGKKPNFKFKAKGHIQLATDLDIIDYERSAKIAGSGFWTYKGQGAILEWALLNYLIDFHKKNNYTFLIPPFLLTEESAYTSGHLPKFRDDLYWTQDKLCLNATSEMMILNFHRDEILAEDELPKKYFAYSTCFRREAGSYRAEERGMVRGHQFNKVEMFHFAKPKDSWKGFDELLANAQKLTNDLGLHFQTVLLAAADSTATMAKTIDIEVFIPSINTYKEVSSVSNALDYQARRGHIRFKNKKTKKNEFVHTLNASGLATSRLIPAILEQNQQADGLVVVPKVLQKYCGFEKISKQ